MRADNRRKEYQREDNMRLVAQDRILRANMASDERVETKRFIRKLQQVYAIYTIHVYVYTKYTQPMPGSSQTILYWLGEEKHEDGIPAM